MTASFDVSVVVVGAPEDGGALELVAKQLEAEGLVGKLVLIPAAAVDPMDWVIDRYRGRTLLVALESSHFPSASGGRLEQAFRARAGSEQRLLLLALDSEDPTRALSPIRAVVAGYPAPSEFAADASQRAAVLRRFEAVSSDGRGRGFGGNDASGAYAADSGQHTTPEATQRLTDERHSRAPDGESQWADTRPITMPGGLTRPAPPQASVSSREVERTATEMMGWEAAPPRASRDEVAKFIEQERRTSRIMVLSLVGACLVSLASAFVATEGFGALEDEQSYGEGSRIIVARPRPRTSALDEAAPRAAAPLPVAPVPAVPVPAPQDPVQVEAPPTNPSTSPLTSTQAVAPLRDAGVTPSMIAAAVEAGELHVLDLMLVAPLDGPSDFELAESSCRDHDVRGIHGFRLPSAEELRRIRTARMVDGSRSYWTSDLAEPGRRIVLTRGATRQVTAGERAHVVCVGSL